MVLLEDMQLLKEYAAGNSEEAFATLVSRHINLVYSAALRRVGNPHHAEEITQAVFVVLARKARSLSSSTVLSGWLYNTARLTGANWLRSEIRRQKREQEAHMQSIVNEPEPDLWNQISPLLEEAMGELNEIDRNAVVLRFFEGKPLKEVGAALGTTDDAAKMRVNRAVEKLRVFFQKRGVALSSAGLAADMAAHSVQAAPAGLPASVLQGIGSTAIISASTLTLAKGTLKLMAWSKINIAIGVAAAAIIAVEWTQLHAAKQTAAQLQEQLQHQTQSSQTQQAEMAKLSQQNAVYRKQIDGSARAVAKARNQNSLAAAVKSQTPDRRKMLAEMFKNPATLKAMRNMQAGTFKKMYAPLLKQLNLTPDQTDAFYKSLLDNSERNMQAGAGVLTGGTVDTAARNQSKETMEAELQLLLGPAGYSQYQEYEAGVPDRMALDQMKAEFVENPLTEEQQQKLLQAMNTARTQLAGNTPVKFNVNDPSAAMEQSLQQQETVNQQVLQHASAFLSPDQLQTLGTSQSNVITMQRTGYSMAQSMFNLQSNNPAASGK